MKTSETGCYLMALSFLDFLSSRNDSFLDNIAPHHSNVWKSLSEKKTAVVGLVLCFTLATWMCYCQCTVCLSHSLETQGQLQIASGIYLELFLLSYFGD